MISEEDSLIITKDTLNDAYNILFADEFVSLSFDYNGSKIKYIKALDSYLTDKVIIKEESNIKREIIAIEVSGNNIKIKTVEGLVKDNKLYNILSNKVIRKYRQDDNIKAYEDNLNTLIYTFNNEKLESISK